MTELEHVSNAIDYWRQRALTAEREIEALKVAHELDIQTERERCAWLCLAVADAEMSDHSDEVSHAIVKTAAKCAVRILNRGRERG